MRSTTRLLMPAAALVIAAGCAGQVKTTMLPASAMNPGSTFNGIVFYPPQYVKQTFAFTFLTDEQGTLVGTSPEDCVPTVQKEEIAVLPDLGRPMLLQNASGWLSSAKFSASLKDGMLASVNAEPTQTMSDLITATSSLAEGVAGVVRALKTVAPPVKGGAPKPKPACNANPTLVAFERIALK